MATKCRFWVTKDERCRKNAEWRFGSELDFCKEHFDVASGGDITPAALKLLNPRAIR